MKKFSDVAYGKYETEERLDIGIDNSVVAGYLHDAGQPTAHFNVLKERGVDSRRVIVDESAPMYFVGTAEKYPPMRFIVSELCLCCQCFRILNIPISITWSCTEVIANIAVPQTRSESVFSDV